MTDSKLILPRRFTERKKWAIVMGDRYLRGENGGIAWDYDRGRMEELAKEHGGTVVDAEELRRNPTAFLTPGSTRGGLVILDD